jgi:hypothetical protein
MPKQVKKKIKTKTKTKTKIRELIGRDLVKDTIGTNQLIDYNNLINILQKNIIIDDNKIKLYKENLDEQLKNQQFNNDPNYQYQLKKSSKKLYKDLKESIFKGDDYEEPKKPKKQIKTKPPKSISAFEETLKIQKDENIKRRNKENLRKSIDKFLVNKSEKNIIPTSDLINKWKSKFSHLKEFKEDPDLNENFSTIVLSYFDNDQTKYEKDDKRRKVYEKLDTKYKQEREDLKLLNSLFTNATDILGDDPESLNYLNTMMPKERQTYIRGFL